MFNFTTIKKYATAILTATVVAMIALTAWKLNEQYQLTAPLTTISFGFGTAMAVIYRIVNPLGWAWVLRGMGQSVDCLAATRIWLLAESRRWLPGGIWGYASRAVAAKEIGVSRTAASASMAIELLVTILAAVVVSAIGVAMHYSELSSSAGELIANSGMSQQWGMWIALSAATFCVVAFAMRKTLKRKLTKASAKFASLGGVKVKPKWLASSLGYLILMAALNGSVNSVLLPAIDSASVPLVAMIAATAAAWIIGFFAIFSPGGILVREAALATLLLPWLSWETGFALAILSRFAQLIAEVIGMGLMVCISNEKVEVPVETLH